MILLTTRSKHIYDPFTSVRLRIAPYAKQFSLPVTTLFVSLLFNCDLPYSPEPQTHTAESKNISIESGTVYAVNGSKQICNPSISHGGEYNGCMLWLNFGGVLNVRVPDGMDYKTDRTSVRQHDRLTISDTSNTVRWFMMNSSLGISGQLQDPEWSTHNDYIIALGDEKNDYRWDSYAIRLSDRKHIKLSQDNLIETATPHLWVVPDANPENESFSAGYSNDRGGFADRHSVRSFFGTDSVKVVYTLKKNGHTLFYIDYSSNRPEPVQLKKPNNRNDWNTESPLISPDGNWIAFNCTNQGVYESYIQRLDASSVPILIAEGAVDPHWWIHPEFGSPYIVYCRIKEDYFIKEDYTDPSIADGSVGSTYKQEILTASGNLPAHASYSPRGEPSLLVNLPFKGGLSDNGRYVCTGYGGGFILSLF